MLRALAITAAVGLAACGGAGVDVDAPPDSGSDALVDDAAGADAGPLDAGRIRGPYGAGGCPSPCPEYSPFAGESCTVEKLECEYGGQFDPKCNLVARCTSGKWTTIAPSGACPGTPSVCPSSPFGPERGRPCPVDGAVCTYVDGVCDCQRESAGSTNLVWACATFTCKGPRPWLGCTCNNSLVCQHGGCTGDVEHGVDLACRDLVWKRPDSCL